MTRTEVMNQSSSFKSNTQQQQQSENQQAINRSSEDAQDQQLDDLVERALACPCIDDLKSGPCGQPFVSAFTCFLEKKQCLEIGGDDCMPHFYKLQDCLVSHPEVFKQFVGNEHLFNKDASQEQANTVKPNALT
eukprot:TRINITY_DN862_c1_g1_i13.p3 TRINITY_DN862_c1_g1~~TRINITY_DN862_c1_g1_i13.p3  ORF type:complete len:134 (+),score=21.22 TRINITY_DN862_c1_g1_i13:226-627(+)